MWIIENKCCELVNCMHICDNCSEYIVCIYMENVSESCYMLELFLNISKLLFLELLDDGCLMDLTHCFKATIKPITKNPEAAQDAIVEIE